jgi:hypothetical protein
MSKFAPFASDSSAILVSLSASHDNMPQAIEYARKLFGPTQHLLPSTLSAMTELAIADWDRGD